MRIRYSLALFSLLLVIPVHHSFAQHSRSKAGIIPKAKLPPQGTMFVNTYYVTDSLGNLVPKKVADPEMPDDTIIVSRSGFKFENRPECIELTAKAHKDTTIVSYARNGDLFMWIKGKDSEWMHLPFGYPIGKKVEQTLHADSGIAFGQYYFMPHSRTLQVVGYDTASFNGRVYPCIKLELIDSREWEGKIWENATNYWYAPEIGYFIHMNFGWGGPYFLHQYLAAWNPPATTSSAKTSSAKKRKAK